LHQTDLDGSNGTDLGVIGDFSSGKFLKEFVLTADKIFYLVYSDAGEDDDFADGVTNTDTSLVSATATFVTGDVGKTVTGDGIPDNTTIASRTNGTTVVLSHATTATDTGTSFTIVDRASGSAGEGFYCIELAGVGQLA
jgi:hypothetical protein